MVTSKLQSLSGNVGVLPLFQSQIDLVKIHDSLKTFHLKKCSGELGKIGFFVFLS